MALQHNRIHQGDCIRRLGDIDAGSVDLVFADPPFNIGYDYDVYDDRQSREDYLKFSREWMAGVHRALKPAGTFWLAIGDEYAAELKLVAQNDVGMTCRSWVIWYYTFGVNCTRGFSRSHTHLFHFVKDPDGFTFNGHNPAVRVASARQLVYADSRANSRGRLPDNTWILRPQDAPSGAFAPMHDTWFYSRVAGTFKEREGFHGCQMPEQLLGRIIRISSNPGDLVVDPFGGSGTTLAVAKKLGRNWLGIEMSRDYVKRIGQRLDRCEIGAPLDGAADPVRSAPSTAKGKKRGRYRNGRLVQTLDDATAKGIVSAYKSSCTGNSTDVILCDPELNRRFIDQCKRKALQGDARTWNQMLLRIRKAGKLPTTDASRKPPTAADMDPFSAASEVAMHLLGLDYGMTLDEMLSAPMVAEEFDGLAADFAAGYTPFQYRWAAMVIRKRAKRSRALADARFQDWLTARLPRPVALERSVDGKHAHPGVYIVESRGDALYVGATLDVNRRAEQIVNTKTWRRFDPDRLRIIPEKDQSARHGLQSILIQRTNPLLNAAVLRPERETSPSGQ
ncbi:MAG: site-specific DNA-methyltransferase [Phycisphaeraceae bacterium]|nr:site-specific DNA-methyltransferase [Phycisphaeraceae bacterium]